MDVLTAIRERQSVRAYLDKPVPQSMLTDILDTARFAPSGVNTQPWQIAVLTGKSKQALTAALLAARHAGLPENPDYRYYPDKWVEPYKSRRFACGMALYGALGIEREDTQRRQSVWDLNYHFFHAPVGLIFYLDKIMQVGSYMDVAMCMQNVMIAARHFGLETCPQAAIADYPDVVRETLSLTEDKAIICGMALGYPEMSQPINGYRTERLAVDEFTTWYD